YAAPAGGGSTAATTPVAAAATGTAPIASAAVPAGGAATAVGGGGAARPPAAATVGQSIAASKSTSGQSRGGIQCAAGVRQLPDSRYAPQCVEAFNGNNGGATSP